MNSIKGLTYKEVEESRRIHGTNQLTEKKKSSFWKTYWSKFDDPIIVILLAALGINVAFTFAGKVDWHECAGILISIIVATFVSSISEFSNENTFRKLQEEASGILCKVFRSGKAEEIPISDLVVGDMVILQAGDLIPADGRIFSGHIMADQSPLNGESKEVKKTADKTKTAKKSVVADFWDKQSLYRGSMVCSGECVMHVDCVGDETVYGKLTKEIQTETRESPLAVKLSKLAKSISKFGYISAVCLVVITFFQNAFFDNNFNSQLIAGYFADTGQVISDVVSSVIIGIIVIVVAVPEGLPLMIAIVCSLNMKKLLNSKVLVRKLVGIETAGSINILFSDKTGTITKGKPKVIGFINGEGENFSFFSDLSAEMRSITSISVAANSAAKFSGKNVIGGNATEKALLKFVGSRSVLMDNVDIVMSIPFDSASKFSAVQVQGRYNMTMIKGAPELILKNCDEYYDNNGIPKPLRNMSRLENEMNMQAQRAVRLLALAVSKQPIMNKSMPDKLILVGVMAIRDDVRPEARKAIAELNYAGIQTVMITGDRKETAVAIAKDAGLLTGDDKIVLTSNELNRMTDFEIKKLLPNLCVVARAMPTDKSRLVKLAQELNLVVGMTGDGVNDAPALKRADVGFAMGSGSEVAKEAGDIVILDDNFFSIRNAVLYGRTIYKSIKKFIQFQLTINVAAVTISILGPIAGVEKPLDISQMIWTNLMIDSLAAIAFGGEPALKRFLAEKPKHREEDIIDKKMWGAIIFNGLYICLISMIIFISPWIRNIFRPGDGDIYFYTGYFTFFIFICIFNAFNARTDSIDLFENISLNKQFLTVMGGIGLTQVFMTYFGGNILRTSGLNLSEWLAVLSLAVTIIPLDVFRKIIIQKKKMHIC